MKTPRGVFRRAPELKAVFESDVAWFRRHLGRNYRLRPPSSHERVIMREKPPGTLPCIVVRKTADGLIVLPCWVDWLPLNSEAMAAQLCRQAAAASDALQPLLAAMRSELEEGQQQRCRLCHDLLDPDAEGTTCATCARHIAMCRR
jgi:hypothetical protein